MNPAEFANIAASEERFWWFAGMRRILFGLLDQALAGRPPGRALEAGCGIGFFSKAFEQRYGWPVVPLDLGWEGLRHARKLGVTRLVRGNVARLPFPGDAFDLVLSLDVLVHFSRGEESIAISEMTRVLAPGGLIVIRVSALDLLRSRHSEFAFERQRFTRGRLLQVVERQGIRVLRATYANSLLMPVALAKFRIWEPLTRRPPSSGTAPVPGWLNRLLSAPLAIEAAAIRAGLNFPLGQSLVLMGEKRA
jgi:SAM-dependent methyltransferase